jgi:hypothetical protein
MRATEPGRTANGRWRTILCERRVVANGFVDGETAFKAVWLLAALHKRSLKESWPLEAELGPFTNDAFHSLLSERAFLQRYESHDFWELIARLV